MSGNAELGEDTMALSGHLLAVACVAMIAAGQVLFKFAAEALRGAGTPFHNRVLLFAAAAILLYGTATVLWIVLLQHSSLSRLYPYMALSFIFVAFASWLVFNEHIAAGQIAGLALIVGGLILATAS
jgi:drug/metabolite transporter (DMT)-like permease